MSLRLARVGRAACRSVMVAIAVLITATFGANAQAPERPFRIGYIQTATPDEQTHLTKAFEEGLRDLGYVEGRNSVLACPRTADRRGTSAGCADFVVLEPDQYVRLSPADNDRCQALTPSPGQHAIAIASFRCAPTDQPERPEERHRARRAPT